jgi:hypothetical protein
VDRNQNFIEYTQIVWGYSELARRALALGEDPGPFLSVILSVSEGVAGPQPVTT